MRVPTTIRAIEIFMARSVSQINVVRQRGHAPKIVIGLILLLSFRAFGDAISYTSC
jgi:hypothetical protein